MEVNRESVKDKRARATKRVGDLKDFYAHLAGYLFINTMITVVIIVIMLRDGRTLLSALTNFGTFSLWFFWGIGLFFHAWYVFGKNPFFSKKWEAQKIKELVEKDEREAKKYL